MRALGAAIAFAGLTAAPLLAQETTTNVVTPAPTPAPDTVGPEQLRDFSLPGTVTRRTNPPATIATDAATSPHPSQPQLTSDAPLAVRTRPVPSTPPSRSVTVALPAPDPLAQRPTLAPPVDETTPSLESQPEAEQPAVSPASALPAGDNEVSLLPWLFALLLVAAGVAWFVWRQRSAARPAYASSGASVQGFVASPPAPSTSPRIAHPAPAPAPAPGPPRSDGIVSTRLRPWLEIEFGATRAVVTDDAATVHFDIMLYNSGSAPARDVLVEGRMFNAGPDQDREIGSFMEQPVAQGDTIPEIAPLSRVALKSAVALPRTSVREYEVEGRKLFVPIVGFNALYRFGPNQGQTSASYIVGRGGSDGGKMAPIRLDLGPRIFRGLSQRQHSVGVRA